MLLASLGSIEKKGQGVTFIVNLSKWVIFWMPGPI